MNFPERATALLELGLAVFPLQPGQKIPYAGTSGVKDASKDFRQIEKWAERWPDANVAIACGPISGIVVLDVDPRHGGDATMMNYAREGKAVPKGPLAGTGNGGFHHFFRYQEGVTNRVNILRKPGQKQTGVDMRSTGGYVVGAGSEIEASESGPGGPYTWKRIAPLPDLPKWIIDSLSPPRTAFNSKAAFFSGGGKFSIVDFVAGSSEGERNAKLYWAAHRLKEKGESRSAALSALVPATRQWWDASDPISKKQVEDTIKSAYDNNVPRRSFK